MRIGRHSPFLGRQGMRSPDDIPDLKEEPVSVWTHNFDETGTYLATIEIVLCKVVKVLVTVVCFPAGLDCILKKGILDPLSRVNTQRTIPKRKVDPALDLIIKIPDSVGGKEHDSLIIFQLA
jgi:hypothetical protein